jgi:hypothetical protein
VGTSANINGKQSCPKHGVPLSVHTFSWCERNGSPKHKDGSTNYAFSITQHTKEVLVCELCLGEDAIKKGLDA